jgi:hypothetical protein
MASPNKVPPGPKVTLSNDVELDERRGLLYTSSEDLEDDYNRNTKSESWPTKNILITALAFIALLILGTFTRTMLCVMPDRWGHSKSAQSGSGVLFSNGTHDFKQTVLIVSIDGLR